MLASAPIWLCPPELDEHILPAYLRAMPHQTSPQDEGLVAGHSNATASAQHGLGFVSRNRSLAHSRSFAEAVGPRKKIQETASLGGQVAAVGIDGRQPDTG